MTNTFKQLPRFARPVQRGPRYGARDARWRYLRRGEGAGLAAGRRSHVDQARRAERARRGEAADADADASRPTTAPKLDREIGPQLPVILATAEEPKPRPASSRPRRHSRAT